jgi:hypothetical protein
MGVDFDDILRMNVTFSRFLSLFFFLSATVVAVTTIGSKHYTEHFLGIDMFSLVNLCWLLSGFFEGVGVFNSYRKRKGKESRNRATLSATSTLDDKEDPEVVGVFDSMSGEGSGGLGIGGLAGFS